MLLRNDVEKVEFYLFKNPLYEDMVQNMNFSTSDKSRLLKRREMVRSMRFLRKMGVKLRKEYKKQYKVLKNFKRSLTSN